MSSPSSVLEPFRPLCLGAETGAFFFSAEIFLETDGFALAWVTFARGRFGFTAVDVWKCLAFAGFFSAGRPRPRFFECFAKVCAVEELLRFQSSRSTFLPPQRQFLGVEHAGRRKLGKLAELLRKVKNLFLQIDRFAGREPGQFHPTLRDLKLPA